MKISFISLCTPTPFNNGAASALPYHMAKYREDDVELEIYSFNINHIEKEMIEASEKELNAKIHIIPLPIWYKLMFKLHLLFIRVFLKYPIMAYLRLPKKVKKQILESNPDAIWVYGEDISGLACLFPGKRCVVTTPDCEALYYYRELSHRGQFTRLMPLLKNALMYGKYARVAEDFPTENVRFHLVGKEDCVFLQNINPKIDATFINHPHYDYSEKKVIKFSQPKIKLLVAGRYDFYMKDKCDELFKAMINVSADLKDHYMLTFLGKGWDEWKDKFAVAGYDVNHIKFAPDYVEELIKHDIQITPIGVGTGTKGKVLDAFANGLMVIGTLRALENIQIVPGESCILYDKPDEAIESLCDIATHPHKYEQMAENGRKAVLMHHDRKYVAQQFFNLFK
ncbi:MAG: glycosyltransferase [Bacteroidales bacterium]|nr:glycosyltransferase [Bacteroidales bacterium]